MLVVDYIQYPLATDSDQMLAVTTTRTSAAPMSPWAALSIDEALKSKYCDVYATI